MKNSGERYYMYPEEEKNEVEESVAEEAAPEQTPDGQTEPPEETVYYSVPGEDVPAEPEPEPVKEKKIAGIAGALVYALAGGIFWLLLHSSGIYAVVVGFICVTLASKGYEAFAGKISKFGVFTSGLVSLIVLLASWYGGYAWALYKLYLQAFEEGQIYESLPLAEVFSVAYKFIPEELSTNFGYFIPLILAIILLIAGMLVALSNVKKRR